MDCKYNSLLSKSYGPYDMDHNSFEFHSELILSKQRFQTLIMLNLLLGPACEAFFYQTIFEERQDRDYDFLPYWPRKLLLTVLSPILATVEEIWRAWIFFSKSLSLSSIGRVQLEEDLYLLNEPKRVRNYSS